MPVQQFRFLASCLFVAVCLVMSTGSTSLLAKDQMIGALGFAGNWSDQQNSAIKMSVREDGGLFRVSGGDEAYGYSLSCLAKGMQAVCTGNGGRMEGENFLYQSTIIFTRNGMAIESWKAFNNLQTVNGKTTWTRN